MDVKPPTAHADWLPQTHLVFDRTRRIGLAVLLVLTTSCDPSADVVQLWPGGLQATVSHDRLETEAGGSDVPLAARITDDHGRAVAGVEVSFSTAEGGTVDPPVAKSSTDGYARTAFRPGTLAGDYSVAISSSSVQSVRTPSDSGSSVSGASSDPIPTAQAKVKVRPSAPQNVTVSPGRDTLGITGSLQLTAVVRDRFGNLIPNPTLTWSTNQTQIAQVSGSGLVTGRGAGEATVRVTAWAGGQSATGQGQYVVVALPGRVADLASVSSTASSVALRFTETTDGIGGAADYQVRYQRASTGASWATGTVVDTGSCAFPVEGTTVGASRTCTVEGLASGADYVFQLVSFRLNLGQMVFGPLSNSSTARTTSTSTATTLTAVSGGGQSVPVGAAAPQPLRIRVASTDGAALSGVPVTWTVQQGTAQLDGTINASNASGEASTGVTMGTTAGPVVVRAAVAGTGHVDFTLTATPGPVTRVTVSPTAASVAQGQSVQLTASAADAHGNAISGVTLQWASLLASVATVGQDGRVTGVSAGLATVEARSGTVAGSAQVNVTAPTLASPGTVSDLSVPATTTGTATLRFTQVGDGAGAPADYHIRYRVDSPMSHWGTATVVQTGTCALPVEGTAVGSALTCSVEGLQANLPYAFQLVAFRSSGGSITFGGLSNTSVATTSGGTTTNSAPATPSISVSGITTTGATANGNAFSDPNAGDTHGASEWQVDEAGGNWSSLAANSGVTTTSRTSWTAAGLASGTAYQARVRYRDNRDAWSGWSSPASFTTGGTPPPPPPPPPTGDGSTIFSSNWSTRGTSDAALRDGGWTNRWCMHTDVMEIIDGDPVGWSLTDNVARINIPSTVTHCTGVEVQRPAGLATGQDYFIRMYIRNDATTTVTLHPITIHHVGNIQAVLWSVQNATATSYRPQLATDVGGPGTTTSDLRWTPQTPLPNGTWLRFEWNIDFVNVRATDADVRIWPRVYDMAGTLLYDASSYVRAPGWGGSATQTLAAWYAAGGTLRFDDLSLTRNFGVGYEGQASARAGNTWYYSRVGIGVNGWVGP